VIYMESLTDARSFLSAARAFARNKPIIVLKAGKSSEGAKAALSHTGSLAGNDFVLMQPLNVQELFALILSKNFSISLKHFQCNLDQKESFGNSN